MRKKRLLWAIFLLYLAVLLRITVFRSDFGAHPLFADGKILWVPFVNLVRILKTSLFRFTYLLIGNLIWFSPFGLLVPILTGWSGKRTVLLAFGLSFLIEAQQFIFGTGYTEVEDLILNTMGAAMGFGVYWKQFRSRCNSR